jgi:type II secretory pathway pseudopilin PulG
VGDLDPDRRPSREAGFTLVMFFIIIAVMAIMMGATVQLVSFTMQREREEELIFRGQQYVEAIRLYKAKYGRHPMTLKEIWEAKPRVIRRKFKDPITDSESWGLVFVGQGGREIRPVSGGLEGGTTPTPEPSPTAGPGGTDSMGRGGEGRQMGPIMGVFSTSCDESIKIYEGRTRYCDWKFTLAEERPPRAGGRPPGVQPPGVIKPPGGQDDRVR